jgi:beta-phosphoglucomutase-like phosphatase (HAD superfamily)
VTRGKPDPACYLEAAARLSSSPGECVVFEDSVAGLAAGRAAGMTLVALATTLPAGMLYPLASRVFRDFTDPAAILDFLSDA